MFTFSTKSLANIAFPNLAFFFPYELFILCKGERVLRDKCLYLERSGIGCKKFQRVHPELFLVPFFYSVYYRPKFYFYWPTLLSESAHMNCASSARVTEFLEISVFTWNNQLLAAKTSEECTPEPFFTSFYFFLLSFSIDQMFTSTGRLFRSN